MLNNNLRSHWQTWLVLGLMLMGAVIRFWNFVPGVMFQGDQARDAIVVSNMFREKDLVFIGPASSVGNIFLGPLYYYFMLPWLWLSYPSPLGPVVAVAILNIIGIGLMYVLGKEIVGKKAALISSFLFATSSVLIEFSRFSWNPNPSPIVMMILVWSTYRALTKHTWYWLLAATAFSILIQLHYITLLTLGGLGLAWLYQIWLKYNTKNDKKEWRSLVFATIGSVAVVLVSLLPLILFDLRHQWLNTKAFIGIFTSAQIINPQQSASLFGKVGEVLYDSEGRALAIGYEHFFGYQRWLGDFSLIVLLVSSLYVIYRRSSRHHIGLVLLLLFFSTTIFGTALYQNSLFTHYILFIFPVVFWWWGYWLGELWQKWWGKGIVIITLVSFLFYNTHHYKLSTPSWSLTDVKATSELLYDQLRDNEKYSLVLLAPSKDLYAQNYRYFLSTTDRPPLPPERAAEADTLVVINEEHVSDIAEIPIYEIVIFPNKSNPSTLSIPRGPEISIFRR